jgi:hypothetical protein
MVLTCHGLHPVKFVLFSDGANLASLARSAMFSSAPKLKGLTYGSLLSSIEHARSSASVIKSGLACFF